MGPAHEPDTDTEAAECETRCLFVQVADLSISLHKCTAHAMTTLTRRCSPSQEQVAKVK